MNTFAIEIWYDEGAKCILYTVRDLIDEIDTVSETDKFFDTYTLGDSPWKTEALILFRLLTEGIANKYGAIKPFFDRLERKAQALPPKPKKWIGEIKEIGINFPLRLFCYRISQDAIVLFGGGLKDANSAQKSSLSMHFYKAQVYAQSIETALQEGIIEIAGKYLKNFDGSSDIIL